MSSISANSIHAKFASDEDYEPNNKNEKSSNSSQNTLNIQNVKLGTSKSSIESLEHIPISISSTHNGKYQDYQIPVSPTLSCTTVSSMIDELRTESSFPDIIDSTHKLFDPNCDPENPIEVKFDEVLSARSIIQESIDKTPCKKSRLSSMCNMEIWFKKDYLQYTGSFKERGASHALLKLLANREKHINSQDIINPKYPIDFEGVIAASAGNHALALAYHGQLNNIPVTVVMPKYAPIMKINSCKQFNAQVIVRGNDLTESKQYAMYLAKIRNLVYINGYDHRDIIAGQGTTGIEICEQMGQFDAIIIPVGGGGLIAGVAVAIKQLRPNAMIIGAEAVRCPSFTNALKAGKPTHTPSYSSLADGLAVPVVGVNAFETAKNIIDKVVTVNEEHIALAILRLLEMEKAVVEGAGACGFAAVLANLVPELIGKRVVILLCGGNIDTSILGRCMDRGLAADGRLVRFKVTLLDRPGGIAQLTNYLFTVGVSLKDIFHERAWVKNDIFSVDVKCVVETKDWEHTFLLKDGLKQRYPNARFEDLEDKMMISRPSLH
ncbi:unnamed protein product [Gordionus sp. m RMFG-2023]|uniref:L-threonine ammonia-lyase-like n=1 Tax=Gordionus sp. m RMFG-2023 TaxID=3053472 RepID=UPI0030E164F4